MLDKLNKFWNILREKISLPQEISSYINSKKSQIKNILWVSALAAALSLTPNVASALPTMTGKPTSYTYPHILSSVDEVWLENVREFMSFYGIAKWQDQKFASKVVEIQLQGKIQISWVLDQKTYDYFAKNFLKKQSWNQTSSQSTVSNQSIQAQTKVETNNSSEKINTSIKFIWEEEVANFQQIFWVKSENEFAKKVLEIQNRSSKLEKDWVIWPATLEFIYVNYYSKMNNLPKSIKDRLEVYNYLNDYPGRNEKTVWLFNVIRDTNYYYWKNSGFNIPWTYFNEKLYKNINRLNLDSGFYNWNSIQIWKTFDWQHFIAIFVNGNLKVLSYATVWKDWHFSPQNETHTIEFLKKNYISWSWPKRDDSEVWSDWKPLWNWWAVMPYAIEVKQESWIYIHMRKFWNAWSWGTAGCYWVPPKYQKAIFDILEKNWKNKFRIKILNLY